MSRGECTALVFEAPDNGGKRSIRLPSDVAGTHEFLWREYQRTAVRPRKTKEDFAEQAEMTAWKVMDDWVRVQMTLIAVQKKSVTEVFLAYVLVGKDETFYDKIQRTNYRALLPEKSEAA